jgi:hypothetical protein
MLQDKYCSCFKIEGKLFNNRGTVGKRKNIFLSGVTI